MAPDKISQALGQGQQFLADFSVQLAGICIWGQVGTRYLVVRYLVVRRGYAPPLRRRMAAVLRSAAGYSPTVRTLFISRFISSMFISPWFIFISPRPYNATGPGCGPGRATVGVRISGQIRSG